MFMKNNLLNEELNQMKYLFGYKAGKVISEQVPPKKQIPQPKTQAPSFRIEGITNDNIGKFVEVNDEFLKKIGLYQDPQSEDPKLRQNDFNAKKSRDQKAMADARHELQKSEGGKRWWNEAYRLLYNTLLTSAAESGWYPSTVDRLTTSNLISSLTSHNTVWPYQKYGDGNSFKYEPGVGNWGQLISSMEDDIKEKLKQILTLKFQELGIKKS